MASIEIDGNFNLRAGGANMFGAFVVTNVSYVGNKDEVVCNRTAAEDGLLFASVDVDLGGGGNCLVTVEVTGNDADFSGKIRCWSIANTPWVVGSPVTCPIKSGQTYKVRFVAYGAARNSAAVCVVWAPAAKQ